MKKQLKLNKLEKLCLVVGVIGVIIISEASEEPIVIYNDDEVCQGVFFAKTDQYSCENLPDNYKKEYLKSTTKNI